MNVQPIATSMTDPMASTDRKPGTGVRDTRPMPAASEPCRFSVLLVDDNAVNRLSLSRWLEKKGGFDVSMAADGAEALSIVDKQPFDLVVLDVMMPVMGGLEVLSRLRETYSPEELPIIIATSRDRSEDVVEAFDLGANDYIVKPIDYPVALARVRAQLRNREISQESRPVSNRMPLREIRTGVVLEDKYRLEEMIGAGSHGAVFRATHLSLNRDVAIKVLHSGMHDNQDALDHFQQEGISACRVEHPNAVAVLDFNATPDGFVYLVLEYLRGHSLQEELRRKGRMTPERAAQIALPVCDVLTEAHSVGIIHRDVKPQNTFLHHSKQGEVVKVLDFGLAKLLEGTTENEEPTLDGIAGTIAYIAPERVTADPYDGRADVYSLGIMLYEMLSGQLPFIDQTSNPIQMMMMHVRRQPQPITDWVPDFDPEIEKVVFEALEKDPKKRLSAAALRKKFAEVVGVSAAPEDALLSDQSGFILRSLLEKEMAGEIETWRKKNDQAKLKKSD